VHDLSREYQLTKERTQTTNLLQATLDASTEMVQVFEALRNEEGKIVDFKYVLLNNEAEKWMPCALGKTLLQLQPGVVEEGIFNTFKNVVETGIPNQSERHYVHEQFNGWFHQSVVKLNDGVATTTRDITQRKLAEQEVWKLKDEVAQKATDKYKALFDSIDEGFAIQEVITDENGNVTDVIYREVNGAFEHLTGMKNVVGKKASEFLPNLEQAWLDALTQVYKTGKPLRNEDFTIDLNRWITYQYSRIGEAGSPLIAVVFNDITERKQQERRQEYLLKLNDALRPVADTVKIQRAAMEILGNYLKVDRAVYADINIDQDYFEVNDNYTSGSVQKIVGHFPFAAFGPPGEKLKKGETVVIHNVNAEVLDVNEKEAFLSIDVHAVVAVPLIKNGMLVADLSVQQAKPRHWLDHEIALLHETAERTWAAVERAKAEKQLKDFVLLMEQQVSLRTEELKQRTQFAEAMLDASMDRITVFDKEYKFIGWNKRCEQIHGKKKEDVIGKTIFEMFPGVENYPEFMNGQEQSLKGQFIHVPMVRDGYTGDYLELFYVPLKNDEGETYAVVNIMHDVSDFVVSTEALNTLNKTLEQKNEELEQKNDEITSFAFVASHDMKEPLRKIHTFSDWLMEQESANLSDKGKSLVEKIGASVHRMEVLIDDILVLTKIHSDIHKEEDVNLNRVLKTVFDDMFEEILVTQTGIHADQLPIVNGNSNQIYYLFKNLISNAIKFQKPGNVPQIKITAEIVKGKDTKLPNAKDEYAKISFIDNGFGFEQRYAKKIFRVFQRLHGRHEYEGTGIGLAICRKIMENHSGIITVESELGKGSVFNCFFPLH
jgi:PAS domain S-box-containing protein